jgi:hypothetical protein
VMLSLRGWFGMPVIPRESGRIQYAAAYRINY